MMDYTSRLFARPSFIEGMARVLDMGGTLNEYNFSATGEEADAIALWSDWAAIGQDMYTVIGDFDPADMELEEETETTASE